VPVIPSLASADSLAFRDEIGRISGIPRLHLDIEDGTFVPNITFGMQTVRAVADTTNADLDAHLLVQFPHDYIKSLARFGVKHLAVHYEALRYPLDTLATIRKAGMKAGLALNFITAAEALRPFADSLDYVLIMTAEPDGHGQTFRSRMLGKIEAARRLLPSSASVWADGNIGFDTIMDVARAGADTIIAGRAIWSEKDPVAAWHDLEELLNKNSKVGSAALIHQ